MGENLSYWINQKIFSSENIIYATQASRKRLIDNHSRIKTRPDLQSGSLTYCDESLHSLHRNKYQITFSLGL